MNRAPIPLFGLLIPWWVRPVLLVIVLVLVFAGARQVMQWREAAHRNAAAVDQRDATADATADTAQDLAETTEAQRQVEVHVIADTAAFNQALEKMRHENPTVDAWAAEPVPAELRQLAEQRRRARDRLGNAAPGRPATDPGTPAPR